ncbi:MAG: cytochrome c maturation protein CcmE [Chitinophagaceae bacterium]|jgi:cytochrome c-type biogenesis protein CcmE|nr:cytochrome c maturation protein CcmE [Chitinophagaceae bacterium]
MKVLYLEGLTLHFENYQGMKKLHIVLLVAIAAAIAVMISFTTDLTTYDTISSAQAKPGKYVHLIAKLDKEQPIEYDPIKDPNYCAFTVIDSLGSSTKVISNKPKPADLEMSERVVLKGRMQEDGFHCEDILLKCPSKYKDDMEAAGQQLQHPESIPMK